MLQFAENSFKAQLIACFKWKERYLAWIVVILLDCLI